MKLQNQSLQYYLPLLMLLLLLHLTLSLPIGAQVQPAIDSFNKKDYAEYLTYLEKEFSVTPLSKLSYETIARSAVAIEKTNGWEAMSGKQARELLKESPDALRYLEATHLLLKEEPAGLDKLIQGALPAPTALMRVSSMLREHGYEFAGNAIGVLAPDLPGKRVLYLASIPKKLRPAIGTTMLAYVKDPPNRLMIARAALEMFLRPPEGITVDPKEYYAIALIIGQGTSIISFETAQQLLQGGKEAEAVEMVSQLTVAQPADVLLQLRAARFLRSMGNQLATTTLFQQALITVPEPQRREVRLDYLEYLQWLKNDDEIAKLQTGKDSLLAGDAALVAARYDDAARQYAKIVTSAVTPVEQRLAAWAGLLDADPGQALTLGKALLPEIAKVDPQLRPTLVAWSGRQLWAAISRVVPAKPGSFVIGRRQQFRPLAEVKEWEKMAAALAAQLLEIDAEACLRPDPRFTPDSFRYPAVMLYAFAAEPEKAIEILSRTIDFQIPPPPGGWRIFDGTPTPDTDKPRKGSTPTPAETKKLTMQVLDDLSRCPAAAERVPPLSTLIASELAAQLARDTTDKERDAHLQQLASIVKYTVVALDPLSPTLRTNQPPPPIRKVEMAQFTPLDTTVRKILANDAVASRGLLLVNEGLRDALLTASNPDLLTALTDLSIFTIQRFADTNGKPQYAVDARKRLAEYLTARPVYDMKPYIVLLMGE